MNNENKTLYEEDTISSKNNINIANLNINKKVSIVSYDEAPDFQKDNEYIKGGYLINCNTPIRLTKSLFMLHNETINVWTHLLGVILVIIFIVYTAIYITFYKTQIMNIKLDFEKIKKFAKPLQDLDNKLKELKIKFDKKFNLTDFSNFMDKFNTSVYILKNSTKETSFSKYYERLLELLSDLKQDYDKKNLHRWPIFIMLISAILCLSFSTQYHILGVI